MKQRKTSPWLRILALCTALGLGGAWVYSQHRQAAPRPEAAETESPLPPVALDLEKRDRVLMPSSKSLVISPSSEPGVYELEQEKEERALLPSSKSITMPVFRGRPAPAADPETDEP